MNSRFENQSKKGSVVLVALCFVAVLGIALASYLAVSNQAMQLSNRSYQKSVSEQLAEMGLEQALWAYNHSNWNPTDWTVTGTTIKTVTRTPSTTVSSSVYGKGVSGTVNVRVQNYDAPARAIEWKSGNPYLLNEVVSYGRISLWNPAASYVTGDIIENSLADQYRCIQPHSNQSPPNSAYWTLLSPTDFSEFRRWYRCTYNTSQPPPDFRFWEDCTPLIYSEGIATPPTSSGQPIRTQIRGRISIAPLFPNAAGATSSLIFNGTGTVDSYNSATDPTASSRGYSAVVASTGTTNPSITAPSTTIQGYVAATSASGSPYAPQVAVTGSTNLKNKDGSVISPHPTAPNVDLTRVTRSPYVPQFSPTVWNASSGYNNDDVVRSAAGGNLYRFIQVHADQAPQPPSAAYWAALDPPLSLVPPINLVLGNIGGPIKNYSFSGNLNLYNSDTITIQGPVILDIQGRLRIRDGGNILIKNTGSAEIYFTGSLSVGTFSGAPTAATGFTYETPADPTKLLLVGIPPFFGSNRYWSTSSFHGAIYMPEAPTLSIYSDFYGAVSAKSITFPNSTGLHYDTSLRTTTYHSIDVPYVIVEWRELIDPAEKVTFP